MAGHRAGPAKRVRRFASHTGSLIPAGFPLRGRTSRNNPRLRIPDRCAVRRCSGGDMCSPALYGPGAAERPSGGNRLGPVVPRIGSAERYAEPAALYGQPEAIAAGRDSAKPLHGAGRPLARPPVGGRGG